MAAKKMGRPKSEFPKVVEIRTRIDSEVYEKIKRYCEKKKISRSDFLRKGIDLVLQEK